MTRWVVVFEDKPAMAEVRKAHEPAHRQYLDKHSDKILVSGGLRPLPDQPPVGGIWIVELERHEDVVTLIKNDPFCVPERSYRIFAWSKAFDRPVTL